MANSFGEFVKNRRLELRITLREFCQKIDYDPSNWSKIERGINFPPDSEEVLNNWANVLKLKPKSKEWHEFHDKAQLVKGKIPKDVLEDEEILKALPVFFRTVRGVKPSEAELRELAELLKKQ